MHFNFASGAVDIRDHFMEHGFHFEGESHNIDLATLEQVVTCSMHPADGCGEPLNLHLTMRWSAEDHMEAREWFNNSDRNEAYPERFTLPMEFEVRLPPLGNPPDLLSTWMKMLDRFKESPLKVDVAASDHIESPTEPPRREMRITACCEVRLRDLFTFEDQEESDDHYIACQIITDLHDLCIDILGQVQQWGPVR